MIKLNRGVNMEKIKNVIIGVIVLLVVLALVFFLSNSIDNRNYKEVKKDEYEEVIKKDAIVYLGKDETISSALKSLADENDEKIYNYTSSKEVLEVYKKGKLVSSFEFSSIKGNNDKELKEVDINGYLEKVKADGYNFMYVGRTGCHYCEQFDVSIEELFASYNIDMYYIDISKLDEEGTSKLIASDKYFSENEWGTPTSILYKDGVKVDMLSGYVDGSKLKEFVVKNYALGFLRDEKVIKDVK